jgi:hypothetical protein
MILGAIILGALIYFIYIPYKAWRLSKNPDWIKNQEKIKKLEAEMEVLHQNDEELDKLNDISTKAYIKQRDYTRSSVDKEWKAAFTKNKKSNK